MEGLLGIARVEIIGATLARMSRRWEKRANTARSNAGRDHAEDPGWVEKRQARIDENLAVSALARGLNDVETAERLLWRDEATARASEDSRANLTLCTPRFTNATRCGASSSHAVSHGGLNRP